MLSNIHKDLIEQYKNSLEPILEKRKAIKANIDYLQKILDNEKLSGKKRLLKKQKALIINQQQLLKAKDKLFSEMQGDIEFAITWMKTGHAPGNVRGIERRSVYQNTKPVDPLLIQRYFRSTQTSGAWDTEAKEYVVTPSEKQVIDKAMAALTDRELEVFLMYKGKNMSQYEIARILNISRNSVKSTLTRANKKVSNILLEEKEEAAV